MFLFFKTVFLLVPDVIYDGLDEARLEQFMLDSTRALVAIGVLIVMIVALLIIASKIGLEDFDYIDYVVMTVGIFIVTYLLYLILAIMLNGLVVNDVFAVEERLKMRLFTFGFSIIFLFGPILLILKASFMFMKPRLILAGIYSIMIATGLSLVILK